MKRNFFFDNKGNVNMYFIAVIIGLLSFFIVFKYFVSFGDHVVSTSNDLACRFFISMKDKEPDIFDFFYEMNIKCKKDEIKIKDTSKDKIYKKTAEELGRCWYRYGSGEKEFLNSYDTTGSWCFTCGVIKFDKETTNQYKLSDFIEWTDKNKVTLANGSKVPYSKTFNMKYTQVSDEEMSKIYENIKDLPSENGMDEIRYLFTEQYEFLQDLKLKSINPSEETYVVFRYDKTDVSDKTSNALRGAAIGAGTSLVVTMFVEQILWTIGSIAVCTVGEAASLGLLTPICGFMGVKTLQSYAKGASKVATKLTTIVKDGEEVLKIGSRLSGAVKVTMEEESIIAKVANLEGSVDELIEVSSKLKKLGNIELAEDLTKLGPRLRELGINNLDEIDEITKVTDLEKLKESYKLVSTINVEKDLARVKNLKDKEKKIEELNEIKKTIETLNDKSILSPEDTKLYQKYISKSIGLMVSAGVGAYIGSNFNFNSNQYVDLLTKEQYYRLCGSEPPVNYR